MMVINGVYGQGITKSSDKAAETVKKEIKTNEFVSYKTDTIDTVTNANSVTYDENVLKTADEKIKENTAENKKPSEKETFKTSTSLLTEGDYKELEEEGISLEEYNTNRLERTIARVKEQRKEHAESIEDQKVSLQEKTDAIQDMAVNKSANKRIIEKLEKADLPVTDENIAKIANAMELATMGSQITDQAKAYLIRNNMEPTIGNLYKAQYSSTITAVNSISDQTFQGLMGQIQDIIDSSGMEANEENMNAAKWLLNHNLPVTEDTLWSYQDLNQIKNITEDEILNKAVDAFASGQSPVNASLGNKSEEIIKKVMKALPTISDEAIALTVKEKSGTSSSLEISYKDLMATQRGLFKQEETATFGQSSSNQWSDTSENGYTQNNQAAGNILSSSDEIDIQTVTVRRQLEEIRLKLTIEAGMQMEKNGIHLETDGLSKLVDGLKQIENLYYNNLLQEEDVPVKDENLQILKESINGVKALKTMPSYILGSTLSSRRIQTAEGLLNAGIQIKQTLQNAGESYETLMTSPRKDLGDSISKAFQNVNSILQDMGLETTEANQRAVRILGYNEMEITEQNIQAVKSYDEQVSQMFKNLQPSITVGLIKKGINPLTIPINELNQQIEQMKEETGIREEEKYSRYLWKLEKENGISDAEKSSYIGIYRLLNKVEKSDGAALGSVIKADQEVTLSNLLTAIRTHRSGGIDTKIDDAFGALEQITNQSVKITDQINSAFTTTTPSSKTTTPSDPNDTTYQSNYFLSASMEEKTEYMNYLVKDVLEEITPGKLKSIGPSEDIMNMSVEKLKESLEYESESTGIEQEYYTYKVKTYQELVNQSDNAVTVLNQFNIPCSFANIRGANDMIQSGQSFYHQLKHLQEKNKPAQLENSTTGEIITDLSKMSEDFIKACTNQQSMTEQFSQISQEVNNLVNQLYDGSDLTSQDIVAIQRLSNSYQFLNNLANRECYEIPLSIGDNITNVNVTILRNQGETGKVTVRMDSEKLGKITAGFTVKDSELKGLITCDNRLGLSTITAESESLKEAITKTGVQIKQINFGLDGKNNSFYHYQIQADAGEMDTEDIENQTSTEELYSVAKTILFRLKEIEIKSNE